MTPRLSFQAVPGRKKEDVWKACQDAVFGKSIKSVSCIALSDGAGSRRLSGTGARKTVKIVVNLVLDNFIEIYDEVSKGNTIGPKSLILRSVINELESEWYSRRGSLDDYACTLIFAAVSQNRLLVGHLGDGMVFSVYDNQSKVLSWPKNGEFANETYFISSKNAVELFHISAVLLDDPISIMLASDGAAFSLLRHSDNSIAPAVLKLCELASSKNRKQMNSVLKDLLKERFRKNTIDDCSIAILADPCSFERVQ